MTVLSPPSPTPRRLLPHGTTSGGGGGRPPILLSNKPSNAAAAAAAASSSSLCVTNVWNWSQHHPNCFRTTAARARNAFNDGDEVQQLLTLEEEEEDGEDGYYYYSDEDEYPPQQQEQRRKKRSRTRKKKNKNKKEEEEEEEAEVETRGDGDPPPPPSPPLLLDEVVNPVGLGRRSRQAFDQVWRKFSSLAQISTTTAATTATTSPSSPPPSGGLFLPEDFGWPMCEFTVPGAQDTTVLVVGATSTVGRILVRKLMLRGYNVKALVRKADEQVVEMLPRSVEIVVGDVGEPSTLKAAVQGCNKIIYCATARSTITADLYRVDYQGVRNVAKAYQDYNNKLAQLRAGKSSKSKLTLAKFKSAESLQCWQVQQGAYFQDVIDTEYDGGTDAKFEFTESGDAVFSGHVFTRGGYVELSKKLSLPLGSTLDRYDGLLLSVGGNGRSYVIILETGPLSDSSQSKMYFARVNTKVGYCRVRVPFSFFRPVKPDDPPLDPFLVHTLTIRFEPKRQRMVEGTKGNKQDPRSFELILEYIKALPVGP